MHRRVPDDDETYDQITNHAGDEDAHEENGYLEERKWETRNGNKMLSQI